MRRGERERDVGRGRREREGGGGAWSEGGGERIREREREGEVEGKWEQKTYPECSFESVELRPAQVAPISKHPIRSLLHESG